MRKNCTAMINELDPRKEFQWSINSHNKHQWWFKKKKSLIKIWCEYRLMLSIDFLKWKQRKTKEIKRVHNVEKKKNFCIDKKKKKTGNNKKKQCKQKKNLLF